LNESGLSWSIARSTSSIQPGIPGMKIAWANMRLLPARRFTLARASAFISFVRNQSRGSSEPEPEISATLVSLSKNTSLK
jgi:hypothetical protein